MGIRKNDMLFFILKDEICKAKHFRTPMFEQEQLDKNDKHLTVVAKDLRNASSKFEIDPMLLTKLFVKYAFPGNYQHTPISTIKHKWSVFRNEMVDTQIFKAANLMRDSNIPFGQVDSDLNIFFDNWQYLANFTSTQNRDSKDSGFFFEKTCIFELYPYKLAFCAYFFTRPVTLEIPVIGDIILDVNALHNFIKMMSDSGFLRHPSVRLGILVKDDPTSTATFVKRVVDRYLSVHKNDPILSQLDRGTMIAPRQIKRDTDAIRKIKDSQ